jgi:hypothetical protein
MPILDAFFLPVELDTIPNCGYGDDAQDTRDVIALYQRRGDHYPHPKQYKRYTRSGAQLGMQTVDEYVSYGNCPKGGSRKK